MRQLATLLRTRSASICATSGRSDDARALATLVEALQASEPPVEGPYATEEDREPLRRAILDEAEAVSLRLTVSEIRTLDSWCGTHRQLVAARATASRLRSEADDASRVAALANRSKDDFLALLGHELRNPLAPIATALQLMRLRGGDGHDKERAIIERQVAHLEGLVGDLLDVSRITEGKVHLKRERVEIAEVLAESIEMAGPMLEQREHRVRIDAPPGLPVDGDVGRLKQVFANLLTNAAKYTSPGGLIGVEARLDGDTVTIEVSDNGSGIPADVLPRIFEQFSQGTRSLARSQGGLGLGLSIVRSMVTLHGGTVRARSDGEGRGSTFTVALPLATGRGTGRQPSGLTQRIPTTELEQHRILIVDDNEDAASMLSELLSGLGYLTTVAFDGPQALALVSGFNPTVALLDIGLPVMDGYELAANLRDLYPPAQLRLIAITGYGQDSDRRRTADAGFDAHLVKPMKFADLAAVLTDLERTRA